VVEAAKADDIAKVGETVGANGTLDSARLTDQAS
jgi:hypothetical protein